MSFNQQIEQPTKLSSLLKRKRVDLNYEESEKETVLNDFELSSQDVLSWLKGDSDTLFPDEKKKDLIPKETESLPMSKTTSEYSILINKEKQKAKTDQYTSNVYERLPTVSSANQASINLPDHLKRRIIYGSLQNSRSGKCIIYICHHYYIENNFTLQLSISLASQLSIPLVVFFVRSTEEYNYPFSSHTMHLFSHLYSLHQSMLTLSITPQLVFTSSYSSFLSHLYDEMHPFYVVTEEHPNLHDCFDIDLWMNKNPDSCNAFLVVQNACLLSYKLSPSTSHLISSSDYISIYHAVEQDFESFENPANPAKDCLDDLVQAKVAYSMQDEVTFNSVMDSQIDFGTQDYVLVLPSFLKEQAAINGSGTDEFCYDTNPVLRHIPVYWIDIAFEIKSCRLNELYVSDVRKILSNQEGYVQYYKGESNGSPLWRIDGILKCCYCSIYTVYRICKNCQEIDDVKRKGWIAELVQVVCMNYYHYQYIRMNLNFVVLKDCISLLTTEESGTLVSIINEHIPIQKDNLLLAIEKILEMEGSLPFSLLMYYTQYLLLSVYKFSVKVPSLLPRKGESAQQNEPINSLSIQPILYSLQQITLCSPYNACLLGDLMKALSIIAKHYKKKGTFYAMKDVKPRITDYVRFIEEVDRQYRLFKQGS